MTASVPKQDPNIRKVKKKAITTEHNVPIFGKNPLFQATNI